MMKRMILWAVMLAIPVLFSLALASLLWPQVKGPAARLLLAQIPPDQILANLTPEERQDIVSSLAKEAEGPWDVDPNPDVGRRFKRNSEFQLHGVRVTTNSAGMRSETPYRPKRDRFRIIVLGDSVAMGHGVEEDARMGEQIEALLSERRITVGEQPIEVLTLGMTSWTTVMETAYLTSRFSAYEPDLVLLIMVANDIKPNGGVTGSGHATRDFSTEHRELGSGFFSGRNPVRFGHPPLNGSMLGLGPMGRSFWTKAFEGIKRLEQLLEQSGGHLLLTVLDHDPNFSAMAVRSRELAGVTSPLLFTDYLFDPDGFILFDGHPSVRGHEILAVHHLHALAKLGWLPLEGNNLPKLPDPLSLKMDHAVSKADLQALQSELFDDQLRENLNFRSDFAVADTYGFFGGFWPRSRETALTSPPIASGRAGLLLRRTPGSQEIVTRLEVPAAPELFPMEIALTVNGVKAEPLVLSDLGFAGEQELRSPIPENPYSDSVIELTFEASRSQSGIVNDTMQSFLLLEVTQR